MMSGNKFSLLCRYGGNLVEECGKVSYKDGTNRMILLGAQEINYPRLLSEVLQVCKCTNIGSIRYKHPELGLDCLVSVENDDDLWNMMLAFETQNNGPIQLFISEAQQSLPIHDTIPSIDEEIPILTEENRGGRKEITLQNNSNMDVNTETAVMPTDLQAGVDEFGMDSRYIGKSRQEYASNIEKLCEEIRRTNSGSRVNLRSKSTKSNHLKLFISYEAAVIPVFQMACKPLVRLISVKFEAKRPFFWFMAMGIDTDMKCLLLACGFIELDVKEDVQDGYKWFCSELFNILGGISNLVFIVEYRDEGGALKVVRAIFPHSHCRYSPESFVGGIMSKFDNLDRLSLRGAMNAQKESEFEKCMSELYEHCREAWKFLRNINPEYWVIFFFKGACGYIFPRDFLNLERRIQHWLYHKSDVSVVVLVKHLHNYMMETFTERVKTNSGWTTVLVPRFETYSPLPFCTVQILESAAAITPTRFRVSDDYYPKEEDVDIQMRNCSCGRWQIFGHLCWHAEEVIKKFQLNRYEYWDECYKTDQYRKAYSMAVIHPLPGRLEKNKRVSKMLEVFFG